MKKQSPGVRVLAVISILWGAGMVYAGSVLSKPEFQSAMVKSLENPEFRAVARPDFEPQSAVQEAPRFVFVVGGLFIIAGAGVLMKQDWARWLLMCLAAWEMFNALRPLQLSISALLALGWNGFIIWFFLQPDVRAQFPKSK